MKRVFMTVKRGMTDDTPVCVWPWEKPILEEIHGGNAVEVSINDMCSLRDAVSVKKLKHKKKETEDGPTMREQFEAMVRVNPDLNPLADPESEWNRLIGKYGMHKDVPLPNVEKVFGSLGNFRLALREYAKGKIPAFLDTGAIDADADEKPLADMTDKEVRQALERRGVEVPKKASREQLETLYLDSETAPA